MNGSILALDNKFKIQVVLMFCFWLFLSDERQNQKEFSMKLSPIIMDKRYPIGERSNS